MTRNARVSAATTQELERIVAAMTEDMVVAALVGDERAFTKGERRARRVLRELARRDWRDRPHGRRCYCSECMYLLDTWRELQRRSIHPDEGASS